VYNITVLEGERRPVASSELLRGDVDNHSVATISRTRLRRNYPLDLNTAKICGRSKATGCADNIRQCLTRL
jgi:hypothetical protein